MRFLFNIMVVRNIVQHENLESELKIGSKLISEYLSNFSSRIQNEFMISRIYNSLQVFSSTGTSKYRNIYKVIQTNL